MSEEAALLHCFHHKWGLKTMSEWTEDTCIID